MKNNFLVFTNKELKTNRKNIVSNLEHISSLMDGRSCFHPSLKPGASSGFLIYSLQKYFDSINQPFSAYLEVGVLFGGSLCALAHSGFTGTSYGCDIFKGYYGNYNYPSYPKNTPHTTEGHMEVVSNNVQKFSKKNFNLELICGSSLDKTYQEEILTKEIKPLDVFYIDGLHTEEGCNGDFDLYIPFVRKGGLVLVDNFEKEIVTSVNNHIKPSNLVSELGVWNNSTWMGVKQ